MLYQHTTTRLLVTIPVVALIATLLWFGRNLSTPKQVEAADDEGTLAVTIRNVPDGNPAVPGNSGIVDLFDSNFRFVKRATTRRTADREGVADFGSIRQGFYYVNVYYPGPWQQEYWGVSDWIRVNALASNLATFTRNEPYVGEINLKNVESGEQWASGSRRVAKWQNVQAKVTIWNPNKAERKVKGGIRFDRGLASPIEFELISGEYTIPGATANQKHGVIFEFNSYRIDKSGDYFTQAGVFTSFSNNFVMTDAWDWVKRFSASNQAPNKPVLDSPSNEATNLPADLTLRWLTTTDPDGDPVGYSVCYGTADPPPCLASTANTSFSIGHLEHDRTHYWRVVAVDNEGAETKSDVRSFQTRANTAPSSILTTPASPVEGVITLTATFLDDEDSEPKRVSWYLDDDLKATGTDLRWSFDTNRYSNGDHVIKVKVFDRHDATAEASKTIRFDNPSIGNVGFDPTALTIRRRKSAQTTAAAEINSNRSGYLQVSLSSSRISACSGKMVSSGQTALIPLTVSVPSDHPAETVELSGLVVFRPNLDAPNGSCPINSSQAGDLQKPISQAVRLTVPANGPPTKPVLQEPSNGATNVVAEPTPRWSSASDPEDDPIGYELQWGRDCSNFASGLSTVQTSIKLSHLNHQQNYCWQVTATDGQGGRTASDKWQFTTATNAPPTARMYGVSDTVEGTVEVLIEASDDEPPLKKIEFIVDGNVQYTDNAPLLVTPASRWNWDTKRWSNGEHYIQVRAFDRHDVDARDPNPAKRVVVDNPIRPEIVEFNIDPTSITVEQGSEARFLATVGVRRNRSGLLQVGLSNATGTIDAKAWRQIDPDSCQSTQGYCLLAVVIPSSQTQAIGTFTLAATVIFRYGATQGPILDSREGDARLDRANAATLVVKEPPLRILEARLADLEGNGNYQTIVKHQWADRAIQVITNKTAKVSLNGVEFDQIGATTYRYPLELENLNWPTSDQPLQNTLEIRATNLSEQATTQLSLGSLSDPPREIAHAGALYAYGAIADAASSSVNQPFAFMTERVPPEVYQQAAAKLDDPAIRQLLKDNRNGPSQIVAEISHNGKNYKLMAKISLQRGRWRAEHFEIVPDSASHTSRFAYFNKQNQVVAGYHNHPNQPAPGGDLAALKKTASYIEPDGLIIELKEIKGRQEIAREVTIPKAFLEPGDFPKNKDYALRVIPKQQPPPLSSADEAIDWIKSSYKNVAARQYILPEPIDQWLDELDRKASIEQVLRDAGKWQKVIRLADRGNQFFQAGIFLIELNRIIEASQITSYQKTQELAVLLGRVTLGVVACKAGLITGGWIGVAGGPAAPITVPAGAIAGCLGGVVLSEPFGEQLGDSAWLFVSENFLVNWKEVEPYINQYLASLEKVEETAEKTVYRGFHLDGREFRFTRWKRLAGPEAFTKSTRTDLGQQVTIRYAIDGDSRLFETQPGVWQRINPNLVNGNITFTRVAEPTAGSIKQLQFKINELEIGPNQNRNELVIFRSPLDNREVYDYSLDRGTVPNSVQLVLGVTRADLPPFGAFATNLSLITPASILEQVVSFRINATETNPGGTASSLVTLKLDSTPPLPPVPTNPPAQVDAPRVIISGTKEANTALYRDGQELTSVGPETSWQFTMSLNEGTNTTQLTTRDAAGNQSTATTILVYRIPEVLPPMISDISYQRTEQPNRFGSRLKAILRGTKRPNNGIKINGETVVQPSADTSWQAEIEPIICQVSDCRFVQPIVNSQFELKAFKDERQSDPVTLEYRSITEQVELTATPAGGRFVERAIVKLVGSSRLTIQTNRPPTVEVTLPLAPLYYTTDGSQVSEQSSRYTGPIELTKSTELKFGGVKTTSSEFATKTESYTIAPLPAKPSITSIDYVFSEVPGERGTRLWAELNGRKPVGTGIRINGLELVPPDQSETWQTRVQPWQCPQGNVCTQEFTPLINHQFEVRSFNTDGQSQSTIVRYHEIREELNLAVTQPGGTYQDSVNVSLAAQSNITIRYTIDQLVSGCGLGTIGTLLNLCEQTSINFTILPIHYTLDGSQPTLNSSRYRSPLVLNTNTTLKFIAGPATRLQSDVKSEQYTIVIPPPVIELTELAGITLRIAGSKPQGQLLINGQPLDDFENQLSFNLTQVIRQGDRFDFVVSRGQQHSAFTVITINELVEQPTLNAVVSHSENGRRAEVRLSAHSNVQAQWQVDGQQSSGRSESQALTPIYFTTDGSEPTQSSPQYSQPITITKPTTLRYTARLLGGGISPGRTENIAIVPPDAPVITASQIELINGSGNRIELVLTGTKLPGRLRAGNQELPAFDEQTTFSYRSPIQQGDRFEFSIFDEGQASAATVVTVDQISEQANLAADPAERQHSEPITVSLAATGSLAVNLTIAGNQQTFLKDNLTLGPIYYTTDGSEPNEQSSQYSQPIRIEQTTTISLRVRLASGGLSQPTSIQYEITPPPPQQLTVTLQAGWNMVALPGELPLELLNPGAIVWTWRNDLKTYERINDRLMFGLGYWVRVNQPVSITVTISQTELPALNISTGAAMIDGRYLKDLSRFRVRFNDRDYTLAEAIAQDLILNKTARWDPAAASYVLSQLDQLAEVPDASAWWIKLKQDVSIKLADSDAPPPPPLQRTLINRQLPEVNDDQPPAPALP